MNPMILERNKMPGLCYAVSDDGLELPVIDITHNSFDFRVSQDELNTISEKSYRSLKGSMRLPAIVRRYFASRSILTRDASKAYLGGMTTYLQKLGPGNLGKGYTSGIDLQIASTIGPVSGRIRFRDLVNLLADSIVLALAVDRKAPLHMINIGGGPAIDSLNTLLVIKRDKAELLADRHIHIHVFDLDSDGPNFGSRALAALMSNGGPLHGLDVTFSHIKYNWNDVSGLRSLLEKIKGNDSVICGSSEGGLFEYGSDEAIVTNLNVLREGMAGDYAMIGSILRDRDTIDPSLRLLKDSSNMTFRFLGLERFKAIISRAGWTVDRSIEGSPVYHVVRIKNCRD